MENILESTLLEYNRSTFLLELRKHRSGQKYVIVKQKIAEKENSQELKFDTSALPDILYVLDSYYKTLSASEEGNDSFFSVERQNSIVERYFKGVNIEDLAMQFDCRPEIIIQILRNKNIPIVSNAMPQSLKKSFYRRKRN